MHFLVHCNMHLSTPTFFISNASNYHGNPKLQWYLHAYKAHWCYRFQYVVPTYIPISSAFIFMWLLTNDDQCDNQSLAFSNFMVSYNATIWIGMEHPCFLNSFNVFSHISKWYVTGHNIITFPKPWRVLGIKTRMATSCTWTPFGHTMVYYDTHTTRIKNKTQRNYSR
jgi:hypothetical protein